MLARVSAQYRRFRNAAYAARAAFSARGTSKPRAPLPPRALPTPLRMNILLAAAFVALTGALAWAQHQDRVELAAAAAVYARPAAAPRAVHLAQLRSPFTRAARVSAGDAVAPRHVGAPRLCIPSNFRADLSESASISTPAALALALRPTNTDADWLSDDAFAPVESTRPVPQQLRVISAPIDF
ncbi:hypothetical protein BH11PLA1_BH11PLA1_00080 [soil metagenome]